MSYLKKYEYVIAVAKYGGISQASEKLNISQPTFSKYIKKLEGELGVELFDRSTLPIKLTRAGECYVEAGKKFLDLDRQLAKELEEIKSSKSSVIRIGISPSRSPYLMPQVIKEYYKMRPSAQIVIEERTTTELNSRLASGDLDLVISILDKEASGLERIELFDESVMLAVSKSESDPQATAEEILMSSSVISVGKGQALWQILNDVTSDMGISKPQIECQSIESALALVKAGLGVMLVPSYFDVKQNDDVRFVSLDSEYNRKVCIFYRKEQFLTMSERDFITCVKKAIMEG